MRRKFLAGLLSLCMMFSLFPTAVFAEGTVTEEPTETPVVEAPAEEPTEEPAGETPIMTTSLEEETVEEPAPVAETELPEGCVEGCTATEHVKSGADVLPNATVTSLGSVTVGPGGTYDVTSYYVFDGGLGSSTEVFELPVAMEFVANDTAAKAAHNYYGNHTTDFFITFDGLASDSVVATNCYLAGYYPSYNAWVKIPINSLEIVKGETYPVITSMDFDFKYTDICSDVGLFICGMYLSDEVLEANPGIKVTLTLGLSENLEKAQNADFKEVGSYPYTKADFTECVAQIGDNYYTTLKSAIAAANGGTVTLINNVALTESVVIPAGTTVTLDLAGYTISQEKACTANYSMIENNGNLTITGNGKISFKDTGAGDKNANWGSYTIRNNSTLVVENGKIEHLGAQNVAGKAFAHTTLAIYQYNGSTTINGGTISAPNYRSVRLGKGEMTINGGEFDGQVWVQCVDNSAKLTIKGGTFEPNWNDGSSVFVENSYSGNQYKAEFNVAGGTFNTKIGCSNAEILEGSLVKGGTFTASAKEKTNAALIAAGSFFVEDGEYFVLEVPANPIESAAEFKAALAAKMPTIELGADINLTPAEGEAVTGNVIDYAVTINGNNKKLTYTVPYTDGCGLIGNQISALAVVEGGNATINNLVIDSVEYGVYANSGDVTLNDCQISSQTTTVQANGDGKVVINGGKYSVKGDDYRYVINYIDSAVNTAKITINSGNFVNFNPADNAAENPKVKMNAEGTHVCVVNGNNYIVHGTTSVEGTAATCTAAGTTAHYKCDAGKLFSDAAGTTEVTAADLAIAAKGHTFGGWYTGKAATCAAAGYNVRVCACGASETAATAATGLHSYSADGYCTTCGGFDASKVTATPTPAPTTAPTQAPAATQAPTATPAPEATPAATPAPEMPAEADTTITEIVVKEEVVEAVKETVTVSEGTATVDAAAVEKIVEATTEEETAVVIPVAQVTEEVVNKAEVDTEALETVAEAEKDVVIELTDVTVKLDAEAVKAVTEQAGGATIEIRAVKAETHTLTETQQAALENKDTAIVVTAQIFSDGKYIGDFKGGKATIKLPFTPEEGKAGEDHSVYFIDDNGEVTKVPSEYVDGHMVFTTSHFSDYAIVYEGAVIGGEAETVVPEAPAAESSFPIIPIVVVIAIIVVGGVVLMMKKRNAED